MSKIVTQSDYTSALVSQRNDLADNIDTMGVEAEQTEKLNSLVPKVLEIGGEGGRSRLDETKINVMREGDPKLYTFATIADAVTFINSTDILKYVIIGSDAGVTSIDDNAFNGCTSLASISMPDSVTSIGAYAFFGCTSLESIVIPDSVTSIGDGAFGGYTPLRSITIPNSVTSIGYGVLEDSSLESITIPSGITSISEDAFSNCKSLRNVYMGSSSVTSIGDGAFNGCESLTSIIIPDDVTYVGDYAFNDCESLSSIVIPNSVTGISTIAFTGCDILIFDNYKSQTGYPWGAAEILIHHEDVTTTIDANNTDRQVPTAKAVYDALAGSAIDAYTKTQTDALLDEKLNVSDALTLGETSSTAYPGNKGKANADAIAAIKDGTNLDSFADVETALSAKLGPSDVDTAISSTSTKPVQNKAVQAPIARLVDAGAKNLFNLKGSTFTSRPENAITATKNADGSVTVNATGSGVRVVQFTENLQSGVIYRLTGCPAGGGTDSYVLDVRNTNNAQIPDSFDIGSGSGSFTVPTSGVYYIAIRFADGYTVPSEGITFYPMLCTAEDYAISPEFVPYAMSNRELTEEVETNKNNILSLTANGGGKNKLKITATSTDEVTINDDKSVSITVNTSTQKIYHLTDWIPNNYVGMKISGMTVNSNELTGFFINAEYSNNGSSWAKETNVATIGEEATILDYPYIRVNIAVRGGNNLDGVLFKPMISAEGGDYQPYAPSNRELYEMIIALRNV